MEENSYKVKPMAGSTDDSFKFGELLAFIWGLRYWIAALGLVALIAAYIYVKFQTPIFERKTRIMLVDEQTGGSSEINLLREITGSKASSQIDNEVFILRSPSLMSKVVDELGLNYRYYSYSVPRNVLKSGLAKKLFSIRKSEYYENSPFELVLEFDEMYPERERPWEMSIDFRVDDKERIYLSKFSENRERVDGGWSEEHRSVSFDTPVVRNGYSFRIVKKSDISFKEGDKFRVTWTSPNAMGVELLSKLTVEMEPGLQGKTSRTNVITMTLQDSKPNRATDVLNMLIVKYMEEARAFRSQSVVSTIDFLDKRLEAISGELGEVEVNYRNYQQNRTLVNIEAQSQLTLTSDMQYENQLTDIRLQQQILSMIIEDLNSMKSGKYEVIPSNIGLTDAGLNQTINEYNTLVAERNRMVANSSENNPRVRNLDLQLADGRNSILLSIENLDKVYNIRAKEIQNVLRTSKSKMSNIPTQQFDLAQIERKQQIIEPLYLLLQQKREEAQISLFAVPDNLRIIEAPFGGNSPIFPKSLKIYLVFLIVGCCFAPCFVYLKDTLRTTVQTKEDVEKNLDVPILATLPKSDAPMEFIKVHSRDVKSESFRMLRSNLKFIPAKVIQITSSTPREGKSFVATNLALSLSHVGKKVLLVGMDLRKPALQTNLLKLKMDKDNSVVGYLIGRCASPAESITHAREIYGIDVAFSGSVPPNPTEILSTDKVKELLEYYRSAYDYVIVDSAPMMPVSDSILINRFVDTTLYVVRSEVTALRMLDEIARLFKEREIVSPKLVLNAVDLDSNRLRYGYGYGTYGYGYGYGSDSEKEKKGHHFHNAIDKVKGVVKKSDKKQ